jgi:hypothetical protein
MTLTKTEQRQGEIDILEMLLAKTSDRATQLELIDEITELKSLLEDICDLCEGDGYNTNPFQDDGIEYQCVKCEGTGVKC